MRVVFLGAGDLSVATARLLIERGHEVIIVEADAALIEVLQRELDCSFLQGDGSNPALLREARPEQCDILFCLTENDQSNILAALAGRSLGFPRVVTSIENAEYEQLCRELDLDETIVPDRTISRYLADMLSGQDVLELSTILKGEARMMSFTVDNQDLGKVSNLGLPDDARVICTYRHGEFRFASDDFTLKLDDEVVILTHSRNLPELRERWQPRTASH